MPDTPKTLPPIWGDDENLRMRSDDAPETELSKALRLIMSPGFAGREAPPRDPQPPLPSTDETQGVDTSSEAVERLADQMTRAHRTETTTAYRKWFLERGAATLRALAAERDNLQNLSGSQAHTLNCARQAIDKLRAERDALLVVARAALDVLHHGNAFADGGRTMLDALGDALDALPPEVRAKLDQSE